MYEPPIYLQVYEQMHMEMENNICKCVQSYDIDVDKEELIKALKYDREQYDKGYEDGQHSVKGTSYWIYHPDSLEPYYKCANCRHTFTEKQIGYPAWEYCPRCGHRMLEEVVE